MKRLLDTVKRAQAILARTVLPHSDPDRIRPEWAIHELLGFLDDRGLINYMAECEDISVEELQDQIRALTADVPTEPEQSPDECTNAVMAQLANRARVGLQKYGVTVSQSTNLSRGAWLQHLQEELLDAAVYIEKLKQDA